MSSKLALVGILLVIVSLVIAACGGDDTTSAPTSAPQPTATRAPAPIATPTPAVTPTPTRPPIKRGGILNLAVSGDPTASFDLYSRRTGADWVLLIPQMNYLVQNYQRADGVGADLAESWTVSSDGTVYTFALAKSAQWHDGKPVTADDVAASLTRLQSDTSIAAPPYRYTVADVTKIEAVDTNTVRITLNKVSASFIPQIGSVGNVIYPKHVPIAQFAELKPIGSGPYKMGTFTKGAEYKVTRNTTYFKKGSDGQALPYLDGLNFFVIPDITARITAFRTRRLDVHHVPGGTVTPSQLQAIKADIPDLVAFSGIPGHWRLYFNNVPPWNDPRARKAIHLAFDRPFFDQAVAEGEGDPFQLYNYSRKGGGKWFVPDEVVSTWPGFRKDKDADIAEAKRLLVEAGVNPATLKLEVNTYNIYELGAVVAQQVLKRTLGIDATLKVEPTATGAQTLVQRAFAVYFDQNGPAVDDPKAAIDPFFLTGAAANYARWTDAEVDRLAKEVDSTLDTTRRRTLSNQLEQRLIELAWAPPVGGVVSRGQMAHAAVKNFKGHIQSQDGPGYRFEDIWLDR